MKTTIRRWLVTATVILGGLAASATTPARAADFEDGPLALSGDRALGERCTKDCQCASRECKGFKCVPRDFSAHPSMPKGKECKFDGDCASCDCAAFKCR